MFTKEQRSTFPYWFAHWCAFNMTALNLGCWKFKYLFHDLEKPFLRLFMKYEKVQKIHRRNNNHHLEYKGGLSKMDWYSYVIDNECSRFTKTSAPLTAKEFYDTLLTDESISKETKQVLKENIPPVLKELNLIK